MRWLTRIPGSIRSASGLEWALWRKLPWIALAGTVLPLAGLLLYQWGVDVEVPAQARALQLVHYIVLGVLVLHWTLVLTVGIGCVIVMVMKGPAYVADGLEVSHSDRPRADL